MTFSSSQTGFASFVKTKHAPLPHDSGAEATVQIVEFADKIVVQIAYNGELDSSYSAAVPSEHVLSSIQGAYIGDEEPSQSQGQTQRGPSGPTRLSQDQQEDIEYDMRHGLSEDLLDQTTHITPVCLLGRSGHPQLELLVSQVVVLLMSLNKYEFRSVVVSVSLKFFRPDGDNFDAMIAVLSLVKQCYLQKGGQ